MSKKRIFQVTILSSVTLPVAYVAKSIALLTRTSSAFNRERLKEFKVSNWRCDIQAIKNDLNFKADYNLESGLRETINW